VFRFLLVLENGEPNDPAVFVTAMTWTVGETFSTGRGEESRIVYIDTAALPDELVKRGIKAVFVVEPGLGGRRALSRASSVCVTSQRVWIGTRSQLSQVIGVSERH
jgi:hypothetical protein